METKPIKDFPNYTINEIGEVFNEKGKQLKPEVSNAGYYRVSLSKPGVSHKRLSVHRLVAEAFADNPNNYSQVNHINENKTDNRKENLEWCTPLQNLNHSHVIDKASIAKFTKVKCETTGEVFDSIKEASEKYSLSHPNIIACCKGRRKTTGKKKWSYTDEK